MLFCLIPYFPNFQISSSNFLKSHFNQFKSCPETLFFQNYQYLSLSLEPQLFIDLIKFEHFLRLLLALFFHYFHVFQFYHLFPHFTHFLFLEGCLSQFPNFYYFSFFLSLFDLQLQLCVQLISLYLWLLSQRFIEIHLLFSLVFVSLYFWHLILISQILRLYVLNYLKATSNLLLPFHLRPERQTNQRAILRIFLGFRKD